MLTVIKNKLFNLFQDKDKKELIFGSGISFFLNMSSVGLGFIFLLILSRFYGVEATGLFSIGQSFIIIITTLSLLGLNMAAIRFIGQYKDDKHKIISLYKKSIFYIVGISILFGIVLFCLSDFIAEKIFSDLKLGIILKITAVTIPFCAIKDYHSDFLKGFKKIVWSELIKKFLFLFLSTILLFVLILSGNEAFFLPMLLYGASIVIVSLLSFIVLYKKLQFYFSNLSKQKKDDDISHKKLLSTSLPMVLTIIAVTIMGNIDKLMIGYFVDTPSVGIYNVAFSGAITLNFIVRSVNAILAPNISQKYWKKDMKGLQENISFGTKIIFYSSLPFLAILIIFGKQILGLFGPEFTSGYIVLVILCFGQLINSISGSTGFFLNMTGNERIFQKIITYTLILNIILNIIFIPLWGMLGAAIATAISVSIWNLTSIVYIKRKYGIITYFLGINRK